MQAQTREILKDTMQRTWTMAYSMLPARDGYDFTGTATEAVADFQRRFPSLALIRGFKLVMDDGDWTIRIEFADGSLATVFVA